MNESDIDNAEGMTASAKIRFLTGDTVQFRQIAPGYQPLLLIEPSAGLTDEGVMELNYAITSSQMGEDREGLIETIEMILDILKDGEEE